MKTQRTLLNALIMGALSAFAVQAVANNTNGNREQDEGPWQGGVFNHRDMSVPADPEPPPEVIEPPLIDADGYTNELILMPDYAEGSFIRGAVPSVVVGTRQRPEEILVNAVNARIPTTLTALGNPSDGARLLIRQDRLNEQERLYLSEKDAAEKLHRYIVLRYPTIDAAKRAENALKHIPGIAYVSNNMTLKYSFAPNDPYFPVKAQPTKYQWGMHAMNFPAAWDKTKGHGYVGLVDSVGGDVVHPDVLNIRPQMSFALDNPPIGPVSYDYAVHGLHVAGIVAGAQNNAIGVSGGCPSCGVLAARTVMNDASVSNAIWSLTERGVQVINMSFGADPDFWSCSNMSSTCLAISDASVMDVVIVGAAGNYNRSKPDFPANISSVLAVGGAEYKSGGWQTWSYGNYFEGLDENGYPALVSGGSNWAGVSGVVAPARSIVSSVPVGMSWNGLPHAKCGDGSIVQEDVYSAATNSYVIAELLADESGPINDGYGSCTGTSMAAPHVSALAGMLRSIYPRLSATEIKNKIRQSGDKSGLVNSQHGSGMPKADVAVNAVIALNSKRLTPLFSLYSSGRQDYFYTSVPQMAAAALKGKLRPVNDPQAVSSQYATVGVGVSGYASFPGMSGANPPRAQIWVFTTPANPIKANVPLVPLYRMSWKCGDGGFVPVCNTYPNHTDFTYTADANGVSAYQSVGYKLDGIEGYIYPKTMSPQPTGTVRLMRKYNPNRDDHAIFPESQLANMQAQGYTEDSGSDWLGYVYPNLNGAMPSYF